MSQIALASKLPDVGTTIFTTMSAMATEYGAINLSQGFPDFSPPQGLIDALQTAVGSDKHQYPPMIGIPELREQIAKKNSALYGANVNMDSEITVTSGATEALFVAIACVVNTDDEVIVFDPAYDAYDPAIRLAGGVAKHINMEPDFSIDWSKVSSVVTDKTRAIIINSPHNPSGSVLTQADMTALADLADKHNLIVISDEVYEHMVFDNIGHQSVLKHESLRNRSFVISSFGKTYHATGWKVGYAIAPAALSTEFRKIHQFVTFTTHTPSQYAIAQFLRECPEHHEQLPSFYADKRDVFCELMAETGFTFAPSSGTYFQLADYSELSSLGDIEFTRYLTQEIGVAAIPVSVFYQSPPAQKIVRFCFAKQDATLKQAVAQLKQIPRLSESSFDRSIQEKP